MNKDEMIKDMARVLCNQKCGECVYIIPRLCGYKSYCAKLYNANCRIIADDEIVVKKRQYEQLKKYNRDRKRLRLKWQQVKQDLDDIYSNGFVLLVEHHEIVDQVARETRQETAREILQIVDGKLDLYRNGVIGGTLYDDGYKSAVNEIKIAVKNIYGIELE